MRRVLITVVGPDRRASVAVSATVPIRRLIGDLLVRCGPEAGNGRGPWVLARSEAQLPLDRTLEDCEVTDGTVLYLRTLADGSTSTDGPGSRAADGLPGDSGHGAWNAAREPRGMPGGLTENDAAGGNEPWRAGLPERPGLAARLSSLAGAVLNSRRAAIARPRPGPSISPAALTLQPRRSRLARGRDAWRATDYRDRLDRAITEPRLRRCVTIAVMSPKGGVGKTTISALLGMLFAYLRQDHVVSVDTNPDYGSLGRSLTPEHSTFVDDLLPLLDDSSLTVTALELYLGRGPHGLMVLPSPTDPERMALLDEAGYVRVIRRLQAIAGVVILDCGTGLHEPAAQAALKTSDQVLLITDAEPATASIVAEAARMLSRTAPVLLVVNKMLAAGSRLNLEALATLVPRAHGVLSVPLETRAASHLAAGDFNWRSAPKGWRLAVREIAAMLAAGWCELGLTANEPAAAHDLSGIADKSG